MNLNRKSLVKAYLCIESNGTESRAFMEFASTSSILEDSGASQYSHLVKPHTCSIKFNSHWNFGNNSTSKSATSQCVVRRHGTLMKSSK